MHILVHDGPTQKVEPLRLLEHLFQRETGYEFTTHLDPDMIVTKIIVTDALVGVEFKNGQTYAAEHTLRQGNEFKFSEFTKGLEGTATVQFKDDKCFITADTTVDEFPAHLIIRLAPKK